MKTMCIDVGTAYIGISMSDDLGYMAHNFETIRRKGNLPDIDYLVGLIVTEHVDEVVVGLPLHLNGSESSMSVMVRDFVKKLEKKMKYTDRTDRQIPVIFWDERLTTVSAERVLMEAGVRRENRKQFVDQIAASIVLQSYLESKRKERDI